MHAAYQVPRFQRFSAFRDDFDARRSLVDGEKICCCTMLSLDCHFCIQHALRSYTAQMRITLSQEQAAGPLM